MSMRNVENYNKKIEELPWSSKEREKYIDLLGAELIRLLPKIIYEKLKGFEIEITSRGGLNPNALSRALYRYFDEVFGEGIRILDSKEFYVNVYPVIYDIDVYDTEMKIREYIADFVGAIEIEESFTPKEIPLKWKIDSAIKGGRVYKVTIRAV